jgi:hypothetical protein
MTSCLTGPHIVEMKLTGIIRDHSMVSCCYQLRQLFFPVLIEITHTSQIYIHIYFLFISIYKCKSARISNKFIVIQNDWSVFSWLSNKKDKICKKYVFILVQRAKKQEIGSGYGKIWWLLRSKRYDGCFTGIHGKRNRNFSLVWYGKLNCMNIYKQLYDLFRNQQAG